MANLYNWKSQKRHSSLYVLFNQQDMPISHLMIFIFASLIAVSISLILCLKLGDSFSKLVGERYHRKLSQCDYPANWDFIHFYIIL